MSVADTEYNREINLVHDDNRRNPELFKNQLWILKVVSSKNDKLIENYKNKIESKTNRKCKKR